MVPFVALPSCEEECHTHIVFPIIQRTSAYLPYWKKRRTNSCSWCGLLFCACFPPKRATKVITLFLVAKFLEKNFLSFRFCQAPFRVKRAAKVHNFFPAVQLRKQKIFSSFFVSSPPGLFRGQAGCKGKALFGFGKQEAKFLFLPVYSQRFRLKRAAKVSTSSFSFQPRP
jgi:hypothetical protein